MKPNKLTPGKNVRWEGSRMMLPEHVEALHNKRLASLKKTKPELDPQQQEQIEAALQIAHQKQVPIQLTLFNAYGNKQIKGMISQIDPSLKRLKFTASEGDKWLDYSLILDAVTDA